MVDQVVLLGPLQIIQVFLVTMVLEHTIPCQFKHLLVYTSLSGS